MTCEVRGASGEHGCLQFLPSTWKALSQRYLGYIARMSLVNELYVARLEVQRLLDLGFSEREIFLTWNGGEPIAKSGINGKGVAYDSGLYAQKALAYYSKN